MKIHYNSSKTVAGVCDTKLPEHVFCTHMDKQLHRRTQGGSNISSLLGFFCPFCPINKQDLCSFLLHFMRIMNGLSS